MNRDCEKLKMLTNQIDTLIEKRVYSDQPEFEAWETKVRRLLKKIYGEKSDEVYDFDHIYFRPGVFSDDDEEIEKLIQYCQRGLEKAKMQFEIYLEEAEEETTEKEEKKEKLNYTEVFIVHGHDEAMKQKVARVLEHQGLKPIILHEQVNQGATIIEKFEQNSDVGAAICLFTADDLGHAQKDPDEKARARQNVVFETGFFIGKLGRDHVVMIADQGVEIPSDMSGVVYSDSRFWEIELCKELKAMGFAVDMNKLF